MAVLQPHDTHVLQGVGVGASFGSFTEAIIEKYNLIPDWTCWGLQLTL